MNRLVPVLILTLALAGCGGGVTGAEVAKACGLDLNATKALATLQVSPQPGTSFAGQQVVHAINSLEANAPSAIAKDTSLVAGAVREFVTGGDARVLNTAAYLKARTRIDAFFFDHCDTPKQALLALDDHYGDASIAVLPAGYVRFKLTNAGKDDHEIVIVSRGRGADQDFAQLLDQNGMADGRLLTIATAEAAPGESGYTSANLAAGEYAVVDLIRKGTHGTQQGSGPPHYQLGMVKAFTVG